MRKLAFAAVLALPLLLPSFPVTADVGFFSAKGMSSTLVNRMQFGFINAINPAQVEGSLRHARKTSFKISIDMGLVLTSPINPAKLGMRYTAGDGSSRTKTLAPQRVTNLRAIPPDAVLKKRMVLFMDAMAKYPANLGTLFLADEPYLNGISKSEMERVGRIAREELDARQLQHVKLGVIFASGMFDSEFARMVDSRSGDYVSAIDNYHAAGNPANPGEFESWKKIIKANRLATYDRAGNLYTGGGFPAGFEVFAFDFYLSTLLLDNLHEQTLQWLAGRYPEYGCARFADQPMSKIRSKLSFFHDGPVLQGAQHRTSDRTLLDAMYECRMGALTAMLKKSGPAQAGFLMISESSNNGVLEFDATGKVETDQPELLVGSRVLDEVRRAQVFYTRNAAVYSQGLLFFTYQNEYDASIKLHIGGAAAMPTVLQDIFDFAARHKRR